MNQRYKKTIMWVLYAGLFLLTMLLQTAVFGRTRILGVKLSLIPVLLVCVSAIVGHEAGGLFCLIASFVWYLSGAADGSIAILTLTVCGIGAGFACSQFSRRFFPTLGLSFLALLLHEGVVFWMHAYLGSADGAPFYWVLLMAVLSVPSWIVFYLLAKAIGKVGS